MHNDEFKWIKHDDPTSSGEASGWTKVGNDM